MWQQDRFFSTKICLELEPRFELEALKAKKKGS